MSDCKQWYVALRIARQSMPALANPRTAVVTLVAAPLLEVVLLLVIALRLRVPETIIVTDVSLVVTTITTMIGGITAAVVRDRAQGILAHIMATAPLHLRYWVSKFVPLAGIVTATNLIVATTVLIADPHHNLQLYRQASCCPTPRTRRESARCARFCPEPGWWPPSGRTRLSSCSSNAASPRCGWCWAWRSSWLPASYATGAAARSCFRRRQAES